MTRNEDTTTDWTLYEIGRYYRVPVIWNQRWRQFVPVLGPLHEDRAIIGFPEEHWHIDWRFVTERFWLRHSLGRLTPLATPISKRNTTGDVTMRRLKCKRAMPVFPARTAGGPIPWLPALEDAYAGATLKCGRICPHQGLPLAGCPVQDGVVVCPGHGLAWDVATGKLRTRFP